MRFRPRVFSGHAVGRVIQEPTVTRNACFGPCGAIKPGESAAKGALRNELLLHEVAAGRKPSGFSVPDGSRRSAESVVYS